MSNIQIIPANQFSLATNYRVSVQIKSEQRKEMYLARIQHNGHRTQIMTKKKRNKWPLGLF